MLKRIRNMADGYKRNRLCIAIAVLSILIFFAPNYRKGLIEGSDAPFHLARIDSLAQDLSKGIFPVKVHTELGYDYGYGVGMIFMPLAIVGMEQFLVKDKPPILLGIGFGGGVCGHTLTAYMAFAVCLLLVIAYIKDLWKNPRKIGYLLVTVGAVLALTISYWLPMWEAFRVQGYKVSRSWTIPEENVVSIWRLIGSSGIGWSLFFWLVIIFFFLVEKKGCKEYGLIRTQFIIILILLALQATQRFWVITRPVTQTLQFPKRLFIPATVLLVFCAALAVSALEISDDWKKILVVMNFVIAVYFGIGMINGLNMDERTADYSERIIYEEIAGFGAGEEWLPVETTREMINDLNQAMADDGTIVMGEKTEAYYRFIADTGKEYYDVPFIYYRGYQAVAEDGRRLEVDKNPETSMVRVFLPKEGMEAGKMEVAVKYEGTVLQKLSYAINIAAVLAVTGASFLYFRKKRKTAQG